MFVRLCIHIFEMVISYYFVFFIIFIINIISHYFVIFHIITY